MSMKRTTQSHKGLELSEAITKLNWNWDSYSDAIRQAHELMEKKSKTFRRNFRI